MQRYQTMQKLNQKHISFHYCLEKLFIKVRDSSLHVVALRKTMF
jgi:hypothetical protein